jgi:hypothetical protein
MNLLCPHCQKMVTVPDQFAGQTMKCPLCGDTFAAPALPSAAGSVAARAAETPPPPLTRSSSAPTPRPESHEPLSLEEDPTYRAHPAPTVPPMPRPTYRPEPEPRAAAPHGDQPPPRPEAPAPPATLLPGYRRVWSAYASPRVVPWIAPVALTALFLLLWFVWIALPGDPEWYQRGWGVGLGTNWSASGLLFLLFYLIAWAAALACLVAERTRPVLPPWAVQLWPWRGAIVGGLALLAFLFLFLELVLGFGLEATAGQDAYMVNVPHPPWQTAATTTPVRVILAHCLHRTTWLWLGVVALIVAITGAFLDYWLVMRRDRPLPRADIAW